MTIPRSLIPSPVRACLAETVSWVWSGTRNAIAGSGEDTGGVDWVSKRGGRRPSFSSTLKLSTEPSGRDQLICGPLSFMQDKDLNWEHQGGDLRRHRKHEQHPDFSLRLLPVSRQVLLLTALSLFCLHGSQNPSSLSSRLFF